VTSPWIAAVIKYVKPKTTTVIHKIGRLCSQSLMIISPVSDACSIGRGGQTLGATVSFALRRVARHIRRDGLSRFCRPSFRRVEAQIGLAIDESSVRFWPKADILTQPPNVRSWGNSGHF
jgi:hypothetical protein